MIYDGSVRDTTNFCSDEYITINSCNIQKSRGRAYTVVRTHGRVDYHILYIVEGECVCLYDGTRSIMTKGNFVLYPPSVGQMYSFAEGQQVKSLWVHFSGYGVKEILGKLGLCGGIYRTSAENDVESCFERMIYDRSAGTNKSRVAAEGELMKLLSLLSRDDGESNAVAYRGAVADMLKYIHSNWQKPITVADVAGSICLSESRTAHLFKEATGKGIHGYVTGLRISTAKELLLSTELSISEIGEMVGFNDPLYFSRAFKSEVGIAPRLYREKARK